MYGVQSGGGEGYTIGPPPSTATPKYRPAHKSGTVDTAAASPCWVKTVRMKFPPSRSEGRHVALTHSKNTHGTPPRTHSHRPTGVWIVCMKQGEGARGSGREAIRRDLQKHTLHVGSVDTQLPRNDPAGNSRRLLRPGQMTPQYSASLGRNAGSR